MSTLLSMAGFALAASISPGPVNIVALSTGAQFGLGASMRHVAGASLGFSLLLLLTGLGLLELMSHWPQVTQSIQSAGVAFLFYMAFRLAVHDGRLGSEPGGEGPSMVSGAAMQWLNPKAWLASLAGMGAYAAHGNSLLVWQFTAVYFVICFGSIACWAWAGTLLGPHLSKPSRVRLFNRLMALLLVASAIWMLKA